MTSPEVSRAVRIPADVDREDRIVAGLTARQVAIFAVAGLLLYAGYLATHALVPPAAYAALAVPAGVAVAVLALGSRDGMSLDRLAARRGPAATHPADPGRRAGRHHPGAGLAAHPRDLRRRGRPDPGHAGRPRWRPARCGCPPTPSPPHPAQAGPARSD